MSDVLEILLQDLEQEVCLFEIQNVKRYYLSSVLHFVKYHKAQETANRLKGKI